MKKQPMKLRQYDGDFDAAYLELRDFPRDWPDNGVPMVSNTINLHQLIDGYRDDFPQLKLDLDQDGVPIGLEILYFDRDDET